MIAFNYGSRAEIARAARRLAERVLEGTIEPEDITPEALSAALDTHGVPDPDLLIRTSGELRLSNFLLWQSAYTEFVFLDAYWPEFGRELLGAGDRRVPRARPPVRRRGDAVDRLTRRAAEAKGSMSETTRRADGARRTRPHGRARLGGDFLLRLVSGLAMARGRALCARSRARCRFAVLVVVAGAAPELGVGPPGARPRAPTIVIAVHVGAAALAAVLAAVGFVGLGLLALPIGAILAMLLSLGRNSLFSALGVFYAGLPAVALIWLRSDPTLGLLAAVFRHSSS